MRRTPLLLLAPMLLAQLVGIVQRQAICQQPGPPAGEAVSEAREIVLQNLAPFARREGVAVVVPFAQGVARHAPQLSINDRPTVWQPFGRKWPDGSWRQALCLFVVGVKPLSEMRLPLLAGGGGTLPDEPIGMPDAQVTFVCRQDSHVARAEPVRVRDLESNPMRRVELRRARIGKTGLVAEMVVTAWRGQPHAEVSIAVFFSDPTQPARQCDVRELAVECRGMAMALRHPGYLGITQTATKDGSRNVLLRDRSFDDAQGLRRVGVLVPPLQGDGSIGDLTLRAAIVAPLLGAISWRDTGAFGPYGAVPDPPPWLRGAALRRHFAVRHRTFVQRERPGGDPFMVFGHGLARMAGQAGEPNDFAVVELSTIAYSGIPSMLLEVELSALQEACRPVHCFEANAEPVDPGDHPDRIVSDERSPHWRSNYLSAYALLSGAHWARLELENEARVYLSSQTLDQQQMTSQNGAPQVGGRVALSAAWNLCVTDDRRLQERLDQVMDRIHYQAWAGRDLAGDRVRPLAVNHQGRQLHDEFPYWHPWQDAIAAVGFGAHYRMTGNRHAQELAEQLAVNVVRHGWLHDRRGSQVATAMRWLNGAPFTAEQWRSQDETLVQWSFGTGLSACSIGAVEIARVVAARDGDVATAEKARQIQAHMRRSRRPPPANYPDLGGVDRFGACDAVVWQD